MQRMTEFDNRQEQEAREVKATTVTEENTPDVEETANTHQETEQVTEKKVDNPLEETTDTEPTADAAVEETDDTESADDTDVEETDDTADDADVEETDDTADDADVDETDDTEAPTMAEYDETFITPSQGDIVRGKVVQVSDDEVLVHVGGKSEGRISIHELGLKQGEEPADVVAVGDEIDVYVVRMDDNEGNVILSKRRADQAVAWKELETKYEQDEIIEATVTERVKGGLLVDVGVRGFVPASHVARNYVEDLEAYIGKNLRLKIIELDKQRNNVVLSHKEVLEEEYLAQKEIIFNTYQPGDIVDGIVRRLTDFGAFVDIGSGVEGLLHVSEMAYSRVDHPDVLSKKKRSR